jgi:hypothetical protein
LLGGMACDPKAIPENHNLLIGFWASLVPDELPRFPGRTLDYKLTGR